MQLGQAEINRRIGCAVFHKNANTGVDGIGHGRRETPFHRHLEVGIFFLRAHVAVRFAGAMNQPVRNAPRIHGVGIAPFKKRPASEIFAVEELGADGGIRKAQIATSNDNKRCNSGFHER